MNYILHLTGFYERVQEDNRLNPTHISLYLALFQFWNLNRFQNPISISRNEMMRLSKIAAFGTYHKCIKQLQEFGYIEYIPSFNPYKGSMVNLLSLGKSHTKKQRAAEQDLNQQHIIKKKAPRQALKPYINNTNSIKDKHRVVQPPKKFLEKELFSDTSKEMANAVIPSKEQSEAVEESIHEKKGQHFCPPSLPEIKRYFDEKEVALEEAEKFFNHYESNGWLVGGKAKMKNWQAAARNWLLNIKKFNAVILSETKNLKPNHLHATTIKSYTDPL